MEEKKVIKKYCFTNYFEVNDLDGFLSMITNFSKVSNINFLNEVVLGKILLYAETHFDKTYIIDEFSNALNLIDEIQPFLSNNVEFIDVTKYEDGTRKTITNTITKNGISHTREIIN